jgi:hypothetical protein
MGISFGGEYMLVVMEQSTFDGLDSGSLSWACIGPTLRLVQGKSPDIKLTVYETLTTGQRALFMFWALHGHADSPGSFLMALEYLIQDLDALSEMKAAAGYFGDVDLEQLYGRAAAVLGAAPVRSGVNRRVATHVDVETGELFTRYWDIVPVVLERVGQKIRSDSQGFVRIVSA